MGFAAAVLLTAFTGLVSYYALNQTASSDHAFANQARDVIEFSRLRDSIEGKIAAEREFLASGDPNLPAEIEDRHKDLQGEIRRLRTGRLSARERQLLAEIDAAEQAHQQVMEEAIRLKLGGETTGSFAENVEPAREELERRVAAYLLYEKQILEETDSASAQKSLLARVLILISGLLAVGLTAILAFLLTRRLGKLFETEREERQSAEAARQRYRDLVEGIPGGIAWEADPATLRMSFVSHRAREMLGYPLDESMAESDFWTRLIHPEDRERVLATAARALQEGTEQQFEHRFLAADGRTIWFQTRIRLSREEGRPAVLRGLSVGITRLKEADLALRLRSRQQAEVVRLGQEALAEPDPDRLAARACQVVAETLETDLAAVFELKPGGREFLLKAGVGWKEGLVGKVTVPATTATQPGFTLLAGEPILVPELARDGRFGPHPLFEDHGAASGASVVMPGTPSPLGVLAVHTRAARAFSAEDVAFLQSVANVLSAASAHRAADVAVRASARRKTEILEGAFDAIVTIDYEGRVLEFNPAAERLFGYPAAETMGREMAELIIPERFRDAHRQGMARYLVSRGAKPLNRRLEVTALRRDGTEFPVELAISRISEEGPPIFTGFVREITERKRTEAERAELLDRERTARKFAEEAGSRAAFLANASALLASSLDYRTTLASVARLVVPGIADGCAVDMLDSESRLRRLVTMHSDPARVASAEELARRYPADLRAPHGAGHVAASGKPEILTEITDDVLEAVARDPEHLHLLRELRLISLMCVPLAARGRVIGAITLASSESGRRFGPEDLAFAQDLAGRASAAIENARLYRDAREAVRARDEFLSIASHELKTPLTTLQLQIQGLARRARAGRDQPGLEAIAPRLSTAERQVERLTGLINNLLDISRITAGRLDLDLEAVDLSAVAREVGSRFREELARVGSAFEIDDDGPCVGQWDRMRIEQIVTNLLSNAVKYGAGNPIRLGVSGDKETAVLTIRDEGIGIPPEHQARIFERFERAVSDRNYGGLGLGLWIVRQIVDALGGAIEVESQPGKGSLFTVRLPRAARKRPSSPVPEPAASGGRAAV
jgi:PAS domain S-box-containing protein